MALQCLSMMQTTVHTPLGRAPLGRPRGLRAASGAYPLVRPSTTARLWTRRGERSVAVFAQQQQQQEEKPRTPQSAPGSSERAPEEESQHEATDVAPPAQQQQQRQGLAALLSPWTFYNVGSAADGAPAAEGDGQDREWGFFRWSAYAQRWDVPWGAKETAGGMALWVATFAGTAFLLVPALYMQLGSKDMSDYGQMDWAFYAVGHQSLETLTSIAAVGLTLRKFTPLPPEFFRISLSFGPMPYRHPFSKGDGWLLWAILGIILAPAVIASVATVLSLFDYEEVGGRGTVDAVTKLISINGPSYISLMTTTAVLAPLLEETVFRGFLLTSLTKFMPTPQAVVASALLFGAAHLSAKDFPQLVALGIVMGFAYVRTRNLLTPILIHGTWNGAVLTLLFALTNAGVNLDELLGN